MPDRYSSCLTPVFASSMLEGQPYTLCIWKLIVDLFYLDSNGRYWCVVKYRHMLVYQLSNFISKPMKFQPFYVFNELLEKPLGSLDFLTTGRGVFIESYQVL